jgi:lipopolysaccharide export system permease protein
MKIVLFPIIQRTVTRELGLTFVFATAIILGLITIISVFQIAYRFEELGTTFILHLVPHIIIFALSITLPVSFLLALTFTFSRMEADREISTLQVSGVHLAKVFAPALAIGLALSAFSLFLQVEVLPRAHLARRNLIRQGLNNVLANLEGGDRTIHFHPEYRLLFRSAEGNVVKGIFIENIDRKHGWLRRRIIAEEGIWHFDEKKNILRLELRGCEFTDYRRGRPVQGQKVKMEVFPFEINFDEILAKRPKRLSDLTLEELRFVRSEKRLIPHEQQPHALKRWSIFEVDVELHRRFAESVAPVIFMLLGAPLGVLARTRSRMVAFFVGFLPILVLYYPLLMLGASLGSRGAIPPWLGTWGGNIILGYAGLALTVRLFRR